jgi:TolB-like protein
VPLAVPVPSRVPPDAPSPSRKIPALATLLAFLIVGGLGLFVVWPRVHGRAHSPAPKRLAVLPFENQGDPGDAYFADGITDELRGKLTDIPGLEVVASRSSNDYRGTTKPLPQIARDLGVSYLLVGKIRWQKGTGGSSRVQVSPELVRIAPGTAPTTRWQQPFDASLTDVFQVQADIAAKVAGTLDVLLGDSTRRELIAAPTASLAAYDEFLKGEAASQGMKAENAGLRRAIGFYQRAVGLDSTFVDAWSQLSRARTSLYSNGVPDTTLAQEARLAAERAQQLRPNDPLVYLAVGDFYSSVNPVDNERAGAEYERGLRLAPDDVDLLGAAAISEALVGRWSDVSQRLQRALLLDPRSFSAARRLATAHLFLRQNAAADSAVDRAADIAPTNPQQALLKVMVTLQRGDLAGARAVVRAASGRIDRTTLLVFLAMYQDLYWVLDQEQQLQVLRLPPSAFDDDRGSWGIVRAELYALRGDRRRAEVYADSARKGFAEQLRAAPEDAQRHVFLGLSLAYLGQKDDAIREGLRGVELMPVSRDGFFGPYVKLQLVRIYLLIGEPEQAIDQLEPLLHIPFYVSPGWLRVDPTFNSLRTNPRFRKLVEERR